MSYKSYIGRGRRIAECETQEARDVACGPRPAFRTPRFAPGGRGSRVEGRGSRVGAFTMIEIAISLAVIGFALVAIIGILPTGMNVQKDNREETIIGHDASILMDAIRNGERGVDDLTNYVVAITNSVTLYKSQGSGGAILYQQGPTFNHF